MRMNRWLIAAASFAAVAACNVSTNNGQGNAAGATSEASASDKLATVEMTADTSYLTAEEKQVVNLLIQAADLINPIYLRQVSADNPRIREEIAKSGDKGALDRFDTFMGPWDEVSEDKPFYGNSPRPVGAGFYPAGLTKAEFDDYLAKNPDEAKSLTDPYTVVKRQGDKLVAVPYPARNIRSGSNRPRKKLEAAAAITTNPKPQEVPDAPRQGVPHRRLL